MKLGEHGMNWLKLAVILLFIIFLGAVIIPNVVQSLRKSKEAQVKSNIHTIQIALERYMTDNGQYPAYLLGGDIEGWQAWHDRWDGVNDIDMGDGRIASNADVKDPLIEYGYITSYPHNPFVDDRAGRRIIARTNVDGTNNHGDGDPRFGFKGNVMGQGLDDMNFFCGARYPFDYGWSEIETRRTLDRGDWMNVPEEFKNPETNMYYLFGGRRAPEGHEDDVVYTFWPGNFFYKATSSVLTTSDGRTHPPNTFGTGLENYDRYILGGYGAEGTRGQDAFRLEPFDPDGNRVRWQCSDSNEEDFYYCGYEYFESWDVLRQSGGLPEVFGAGDEYTGPFRFYTRLMAGSESEFIYCAPDGVPDGVILCLAGVARN